MLVIRRFKNDCFLLGEWMGGWMGGIHLFFLIHNCFFLSLKKIMDNLEFYPYIYGKVIMGKFWKIFNIWINPLWIIFSKCSNYGKTYYG